MPATAPFHLMAKPIGAACNLRCQYCFYLDKGQLYPDDSPRRMSGERLEIFIRDYIAAQPGDHVGFTFQGGEPTLLGVDYFRKIVHLQKKFADGRTIENNIQTNGTLLDDKWGAFLHEHKFLVGLSVDGPADIHDACRVDRRGRPTHREVMRGIRVLQHHGVEFNTLTCVTARNAGAPDQVYEFLTGIGSRFLQFIPVVERWSNSSRQILAPPPDPARPLDPEATGELTSWSVPATAYGNFLCTIFDRWIRTDVGKVFLQIVDSTLASWLGMPAGICYLRETCGRALAMEHNGDVYPCDHYVDPRHKLGNLMDANLATLADHPAATAFGNAKRDSLPGYCRQCQVRFACHGDCPKHRFTRTPDGERGLSYLCPAYQRFFSHAAPAMNIMANLLRHRRPASDVMPILAQRRAAGHENRPLPS